MSSSAHTSFIIERFLKWYYEHVVSYQKIYHVYGCKKGFLPFCTSECYQMEKFRLALFVKCDDTLIIR